MDATKLPLKYIPSVAKALEVILWFADQRNGIDFYHIVKAAFYADKDHIARYGRPIIGDDYRAAWFGPLPQVIYGLLKHDPMEILALGNSGPLPFRTDERFCVYSERGPNMSRLSRSDVEALQHGLCEVDGKSFDDLFYQSHSDPAYLNAYFGVMSYRDFLPEGDPQRGEKIQDLEEVAGSAVL